MFFCDQKMVLFGSRSLSVKDSFAKFDPFNDFLVDWPYSSPNLSINQLPHLTRRFRHFLFATVFWMQINLFFSFNDQQIQN